jgi:hypothetical protein
MLKTGHFYLVREGKDKYVVVRYEGKMQEEGDEQEFCLGLYFPQRDTKREHKIVHTKGEEKSKWKYTLDEFAASLCDPEEIKIGRHRMFYAFKEFQED